MSSVTAASPVPPRRTRALLAASLLLFAAFALVAVGVQVARRNADARYRALDNYGELLAEPSRIHDVPWSYLMALTVLECSGRAACPSRFENHVYERLQAARAGKGPKRRRSPLTRSQLKGRTDGDLRALASSWGPLQIMGWHTLRHEPTVTIEQLSAFDTPGADFAVRWVARTYGDDLRAGRFEDAFHRHNTGKPYPNDGTPTTTHTWYVPRGRSFMDWFEARRPAGARPARPL